MEASYVVSQEKVIRTTRDSAALHAGQPQDTSCGGLAVNVIIADRKGPGQRDSGSRLSLAASAAEPRTATDVPSLSRRDRNTLRVRRAISLGSAILLVLDFVAAYRLTSEEAG